MRVVLQRVSSASVTVGGRLTGQIERGLLVFVGIEDTDSADDGAWLAGKIVKLRIFADEEGHMNKSVVDVDGGILLISQFTLHASTRKGSRPSFNRAAQPGHARPLYEQFITQLSAALGRPPAVIPVERVQTGEFGAYMVVTLVNDGPVTLAIDSKLRE